MSDKLVELKTDNDFIIDLMYAATENMLQTDIYSEVGLGNRCFMRPDMLEALNKLRATLKEHNLKLKIKDAYRPPLAHEKMLQIIPMEGFFARTPERSQHCHGSAIDCILVNREDDEELAYPCRVDAYEKRYAEQIAQWFASFEDLLRQIYQDNELKLKFNYKDYSFKICTEGKEFKFTQTSDGFAAILDIVADLILKMQTPDNLTRAYQKKGIVLIDEVETHLHLELQKVIMPILTKVFPNIQFIITTHSPFVLNSLNNAVAFDLEHREVIDELTQYSYEALAEGYFGVSSESGYAEMQLDTLK